MRFASAIGASLAAHAALLLCFNVFPSHEFLPELDLSSVEVSFAENEDQTLPVSPVPPAPPPEPPVPETSAPPPPEETELPLLPPDPDELSLPEPTDEPPPEMDLPPDPEETRRRDETPPPEPEAPPAPSSAPRQAKVDAPPRPVKSIRPDYPRGARLRGEQGNVVLELSVDERGAVSDVRIASSSGYPELDAAAERAARSARFNPAKSGGRAVASEARLTLTFKLK